MSSARAPASLSAVRNLVVTARGDLATVSWRPPLQGAVARYQVEAHRDDYYDEDAPDFGTRIVGGQATSIVWPDLPLNHRVYFTVTPIGPDGAGYVSGAAGPFNATGVVTPTNADCPSSAPGYCVVVDATRSLGPERRPGAGLLHGTVPRTNRWVRPLRLRYWRIEASNTRQYEQASVEVAPRHLIELLSDAWYAHSHRWVRQRLVATDPWDDWASYTRFVSGEVRTAERQGADPIWEIQNEPENYPYDPLSPPTRSRVEEQYLRAYRAIKAVDPHARVIGPSIDWQYESSSAPWYLDMKTFVGYAAAHHLRFYALSWHQNSDFHDLNPLTYSEMPQIVRDEAEVVRELVAEYPGIGSPKLFVDENSSPAGQFIPGFQAGYLAADDEAGLAEANRSCWPYPGSADDRSCFDANLGELLNRDGNPSSSYWVMRDYAAMTGTRISSQVSDVAISALAVRNASGTIRVLLGRHQTCSEPTVGPAYCSGPFKTLPTVPTTVRILVPTAAQSARVGVEVIPDSHADLTSAPATVKSTVRVRRGVATIQVPAFGDGQAVFLTIKPSSSAGAAPGSSDRRRTEVPAARGQPVPTRLLPEVGSHQAVAVLHPYADRLTAMLTDQYGNALSDRQVTFTLNAGYGRFPGGATTAVVRTDRGGLAIAPVVTAGLSLGAWTATARLTGLGPGSDGPVAYFSLNNDVL